MRKIIYNIKVLNEDALLKYPSGICFDKANNSLYITEMNGSRVIQVDRETGEMSHILSAEDDFSLIQKPLAIAFSEKYGIYVTDVIRNNIFKKKGKSHSWEKCEIATHTSLNLPGSISIDELGGVYITDFLNERILYHNGFHTSTVLDGSRKLYDVFENQEYVITRPYGIYYRNRKLYITDTINRKIRILDIETNTIGTVFMCDRVKLIQPIGITVDDENNIFICEPRRIWGIDEKGDCFLQLDTNNWRQYISDFSLEYKLAYIGAIVSTDDGELCFVDTIRGLIYRIWYG